MAGISRRQFLATGLVAGGGLVVGTVLLRPSSLEDARRLVASPSDTLLNTWVKLASDGKATIYVPHSEMGQGVHTSLAMMLAEEMDLAWEQVVVEQAPAELPFANRGMVRGFLLPGWEVPKPLLGVVDFSMGKTAELMSMQLTGGSTSVRLTGQYGMRRAGAAARQMLVDAAAETWGVPSQDCETTLGSVVHRATGKGLQYHELAPAAAKIDPPRAPRLKDPAQYRIVGTPIPRVDIPAKVDGSAIYGIDANVPGMRYAAIRGVPVFGGSVRKVDPAPALAVEGVEKVLTLEDAVVVIADRYWRAERGLEALSIEFDAGPNAGTPSPL